MKTIGISILVAAGIGAALGAERNEPVVPPADRLPEREPAIAAELSLAMLLEQVLDNNPALRAARLRWEAQLERPEIEGALPDPMITYGYWFQNVETRAGAMNQRVSASQKIPFAGKRSLAAERARQEAHVAMWEYQASERDLILEAKQGYFDLTQIDETQRILQGELELLSPIISTVQARYQAGQSGQADVLKAQLALNTVQSRLLDLAAQREAVVARLNALRNRREDEPIREVALPEPLKLPARESLYSAAFRYRQELQEAGVAIERDEAGLALAKKAKWPDFNIGVDYTQINDNIFSDPPDNGQDAVMGFVSVNIPIWVNKWKAQEREAEKRLAATRTAKENVLNRTFAEVREAWFESRVQQDQVALYGSDLLPQAEQSLAASMAAYESGGGSFIDLLDSERALLTLRLGFVRAKTALAKALARLERAVGVDLEKLSSAPEMEN